MATLAADIGEAIFDRRPPALDGDLPKGELIVPHYDGCSIVNLPATTAILLGVEPPGVPPLTREVWGPLSGGDRCVVPVIVDSLGYRRLQRLVEPEADTLLHQLLRRGGQFIPLTSVCSSRTMTALSCLRCGRTPVEHGMLARLFMGDRGLEATMIYSSAVGYERHNVVWGEGMELAETSRACGWMSEL